MKVILDNLILNKSLVIEIVIAMKKSKQEKKDFIIINGLWTFFFSDENVYIEKVDELIEFEEMPVQNISIENTSFKRAFKQTAFKISYTKFLIFIQSKILKEENLFRNHDIKDTCKLLTCISMNSECLLDTNEEALNNLDSKKIHSKYSLQENESEFIKLCLKIIGVKLIFDILILNRQGNIEQIEGIKLINNNAFGSLRFDYDNNIIICNFIENYKWTKPILDKQETFNLSISTFIRCAIGLIINFYEETNLIENVKINEDYDEFPLQEQFPLYEDLNEINIISCEEYHLKELDIAKEVFPFNITKEDLLEFIKISGFLEK